MRLLPGSYVLSMLAVLALGVAAVEIAVADEPAPKQDDEQIGEVLKKPIYRRDVQSKSDGDDLLLRVFVGPVMEKYQAAHKKEIEPTKAEIEAFADHFDKEIKERAAKEEPELKEKIKQLDEKLANKDLSEDERKKLQEEKEFQETILQANKSFSGKDFAAFMLPNWKFQKHLYDNYGGGRLLWQQAGMEAFDAMHKWLQAHEKAGDFKITDEKLRAKLYHYWTRDHGAFLIEDPATIKKEFLEPEWAPKKPAKAATEPAKTDPPKEKAP